MSATKRPRGRLLATCGELGGIKLNSEPCTHVAGWQTSHRGRGRCRLHDGPQEAKKATGKRRFLEAIQSGKMSVPRACRAIGIGVPQLWRWRKADPEFAQAMVRARRVRDEVESAAVEESLYRRCISGKASAAEVIFFLKNRAPERWKDRHILAHEDAETLEQLLRDVAEDEARQQRVQGAGELTLMAE